MRAALVANLVSWRKIQATVPYFQFDIMQLGDSRHKTEIYSLNVMNPQLSKVLIEVLKDIKTPIIRVITNVIANKGDLELELLDIVSIHDTILEVETT